MSWGLRLHTGPQHSALRFGARQSRAQLQLSTQLRESEELLRRESELQSAAAAGRGCPHPRACTNPFILKGSA